MAKLEGKVARVISSNELIINLGSEHGVEVGMTFDVIDQRLQDITDPDTEELLGSFNRSRVTVRVIQVAEKMALAKPEERTSSLLATITALNAPASNRAILGDESWPEGVRRGDIVQLRK